jgi:hypothetical protein
LTNRKDRFWKVGNPASSNGPKAKRKNLPNGGGNGVNNSGLIFYRSRFPGFLKVFLKLFTRNFGSLILWLLFLLMSFRGLISVFKDLKKILLYFEEENHFSFEDQKRLE